MREIKFRAWNKEDKRMIKWHDNFFYDTSEVTNWSGDFSNIDMPLMQYTGLKDKNGVEIYEGDILQPLSNEKKYYVVVWNKVEASFKRKYKFIRKYQGEEWEETTELPVYQDSYKVIGNIFENPELIA